MKTFNSIWAGLTAVLMTAAVSGCGMVSQLQATATPTPTATISPTAMQMPTPTPTTTPTLIATPTATPTRTYTPSPTSTLVPPLFITGCLDSQTCPDARLIRSFFVADQVIKNGGTYPVTIPANDRLHFNQGWCAIDVVTLMESQKKYEFIFLIDGVSYVDMLERGGTSMTDSKDPKITYPCVSVGGYLSGWKAGETHTITIGGRVTTETSDGWQTYPPGENVIKYIVTPINITATPTRTRTPIPRPTNTQGPQIQPTVACGEKGRILIDNATGGILTLYLKGPAAYTYQLAGGETSLEICGGSYTYTAYGCGGASISGNIGTSGDTYHKFTCN